jgi:hypothetical protein
MRKVVKIFQGIFNLLGVRRARKKVLKKSQCMDPTHSGTKNRGPEVSVRFLYLVAGRKRSVQTTCFIPGYYVSFFLVLL